jgi:hypothetical protein
MTSPQRAGAKGLWPLWAAAAVSTSILLVVVILIVRRPGETLTADRLAEARARWAAAGISDYRMVVVVSGVQEGRHEIEVRRGEVTRMETGGVPVREEVREFWSVEGMFRFLQTELANLAAPDRAYGTADPGAVVLRAHFDPGTGVPLGFLRHVTGKAMTIEWAVSEFERR